MDGTRRFFAATCDGARLVSRAYPSPRRRSAVLPERLSQGRPENPTRGAGQNGRSARTARGGRRPHCRYRTGGTAPCSSAVGVPGHRDPRDRESRRPIGRRPSGRGELQDRRDVRGFRSGRANDGSSSLWVNQTNFWGPDPDEPSRIKRFGRVQDVRDGLSEMPHVIVNQARLGDFLVELQGTRRAACNPTTATKPSRSRPQNPTTSPLW